MELSSLAKRPPLKGENGVDRRLHRDALLVSGKFQPGKEASPENIAALEPDAVVLATGSGRCSLNYRELTAERLHRRGVLTGRPDIAGKSVTMIGAGLHGTRGR